MDHSRLFAFFRRLVHQRLVNVRDNATTSNGSLDEHVELFVATNGKLEMAGGNTFHLLSYVRWHASLSIINLPSSLWMRCPPILTLLPSSTLWYKSTFLRKVYTSSLTKNSGRVDRRSGADAPTRCSTILS